MSPTLFMEQAGTTGGGMDREKHGLCLLSLGEIALLPTRT